MAVFKPLPFVLPIIEIGRIVAEGAGQISQFIYDGKDRQIEIKRQDDKGVFQTYL
ncbi:MAG: hypothetical protein L3J24_13045 [Xanthomonadales bacterium]|nr:hypothetical protein [Xanthomonadales bacterium]